jgi:hypothetical protein
MSVANWQRWLFWLILGAFSVFFAEVLSASAPFVFFDFFGLLGIYTHYTLHVLVLAPLVIRLDRQVRFGALFLAGAIFGLYEAYMTKVLWSPPWDPAAFRLGGLAVVSSALLVLFWHPFLSLITPLFIADRLVLDSRRLVSSLSPRFQRWLQWPWFVVAAGVAAGIVHGSHLGDPVTALFSAASTSGLILLLLFIWDVAAGAQKFELAEMLPRRKTWLVCLLLLVGYYLAYGFTIRPEAVPGWGAQAVVWGLYVVFGLLLWLVLRQAQPEPIAVEEENPNWQRRRISRGWLPFALTFSASSTIAALLLAWAGQIILALVWTAGILVGVGVLGHIVWQLITSKHRSPLTKND